jgi:hypothetical protein
MRNYMIYKYTIYLLIVSFIHFAGCHSFELIRENNIEEKFETGKYYAIKLITKDYTEYYFDGYMYSVKNDTLFGSGIKVYLNRDVPFQGAIAIDDIIEYKIKTSDTAATIGLVFGVIAFAGVVALLIAAATIQSDVKSCSKRRS